jgi:hypothetical protein
MNSQRSHAYRRVLQTLADLGPSKLLAPEQERIRNAVDNLIFSCDLTADVAACEALEDIERLCRALVDSGRWEEATAMRLADDVARCGPAPLPDLQAA